MSPTFHYTIPSFIYYCVLKALRDVFAMTGWTGRFGCPKCFCEGGGPLSWSTNAANCPPRINVNSDAKEARNGFKGLQEFFIPQILVFNCKISQSCNSLSRSVSDAAVAVTDAVFHGWASHLFRRSLQEYCTRYFCRLFKIFVSSRRSFLLEFIWKVVGMSDSTRILNLNYKIVLLQMCSE